MRKFSEFLLHSFYFWPLLVCHDLDLFHAKNYNGVANEKGCQTDISRGICMKFSASVTTILDYSCAKFQNFCLRDCIFQPSLSVHAYQTTIVTVVKRNFTSRLQITPFTSVVKLYHYFYNHCHTMSHKQLFFMFNCVDSSTKTTWMLSSVTALFPRKNVNYTIYLTSEKLSWPSSCHITQAITLHRKKVNYTIYLRSEKLLWPSSCHVTRAIMLHRKLRTSADRTRSRSASSCGGALPESDAGEINVFFLLWKMRKSSIYWLSNLFIQTNKLKEIVKIVIVKHFQKRKF